MDVQTGLVLALLLAAVVLLVLWVVLPFLVLGVSRRLDRIQVLLQQQLELLRQAQRRDDKR